MARDNEDIDKVKSLLEKAKLDSEKIEEKHKEYGLKGEKHLNFFTVVSEKYKHENLHSDILKVILDPHTTEIGNSEYLREFIRLLMRLAKVQGTNVEIDDSFADDDSVQVKREKGHIDVFVHNGKQAIIIENKINNAIDQKNQLALYAEYAEGKSLRPVAFVYIQPIGNRAKKPPLENYEAEYKKKYVDDISKKLIVVPVLHESEKDSDSLVSFLDSISKDENETARVFIQQYANLLKGLEEGVMVADTKKELAMLLLEDAAVARNIHDVWSDRHSLLAEKFKSALSEKLGFAEEEIMPEETHLAKPIKNSSLVLYFFNSKYIYQIGFGCKTRNMKSDLQEKLAFIMRQGGNVYLVSSLPDIILTEDWVYSEVTLETLKGGSLSEMQKSLVNYYQFLEDEAKKILVV